jgi:transposase
MLRPAKKAPAQNAHPENPMNALHYIGFDVHKKSISFCVKTAAGEIVEESSTPAQRGALRAWAAARPHARRSLKA